MTTFTDQQLTELDRMLVASVRTLDLKRAMITERCFAIEKLRDMVRAKRPPVRDLTRWGQTVLWVPGIRGRGFPDTLDYMEDCIKAADLSITQRTARFREIESALYQLSFVHAMVKAYAPTVTGSVLKFDSRIHCAHESGEDGPGHRAVPLGDRKDAGTTGGTRAAVS